VLQFCNHHSRPVFVAYMFYEPDCASRPDPSRPWHLLGWYRIEPGQCGVVYANDLDDVNNRFGTSMPFQRQTERCGPAISG
jgi:hypothetical protein